MRWPSCKNDRCGSYAAHEVDTPDLDNERSLRNPWSGMLSDAYGSDDTKDKKDNTRIRGENMFVVLNTAKN
ncbi:hypothetical protein TNCV_3702661 [Trichonephila clavipes]|nr:hypothetical protein TNCV_3702661 [Trichonephila clavipes]